MDLNSPGRPHASDPRDDPGNPAPAALVQRALMERARLAAERDRQPGPRRTLQHSVALAAALGLVLVLVLGFDAFLTSMQKVMRMLDEDEARQRQEQAEAQPRTGEPMPAYVVPAD